jgi:hypothetical protein
MAGVAKFVDLLQEVIADGELTIKEIYQIGHWINDNKSVRADWPVNDFYKLLKGALTDGKIDLHEAGEVARLIQSVLREWSRRNAPPKTPSVSEVVASAIGSFDIASPRLPSIPIQMQIRSHSDESVVYRVDLAGPSCECPDFNPQRSKLPPGNLSRCCKHILEAFSKVRPEIGWPGWLDAFIEFGVRPNPEQKWQVARMLDEHALLSSANKGWVNLYTHDSNGNAKFGYNISERRWSYGKEPKYASSIAKHILQSQ